MKTQSAIGGPGIIVEINETAISRRKYNRGRMVKTVWVFGGIERVSKKSFIIPLITDEAEADNPDIIPRTKNVLVEAIKKYILPGSIVYSDMWKGYDTIGTLDYGYTHRRVNHSKEFVSSSDPSVHTQNVERLWRDLKEWIKKPGMRLYHLHKYIARYIFSKTEGKCGLHTFLLTDEAKLGR